MCESKVVLVRHKTVNRDCIDPLTQATVARVKKVPAKYFVSLNVGNLLARVELTTSVMRSVVLKPPKECFIVESRYSM